MVVENNITRCDRILSTINIEKSPFLYFPVYRIPETSVPRRIWDAQDVVVVWPRSSWSQVVVKRDEKKKLDRFPDG